MNMSDTDKITVLLNRLDFHINEIQRREEKETRLFEWSTTLLLAVFAVVIALSDRAEPLSHPVLVRIIATFLIAFPTLVFSYRIWSERPSMQRQAEVVELIQSGLYLFDKGYYIADMALYPERWKGNLAVSRLKRKTPIYYVAIILLMAICVITTMWIVF